MNSNDREWLGSAAHAAAGYAIWQRDDTSVAENVLDAAVVHGLIDGVHTRYAVTENTGDTRLGRVAGRRAAVRFGGMYLAMFAVPFIIFISVVGIAMFSGLADADNEAWPILCSFVLLPSLFGLVIFLIFKVKHTAERSAYTRANLPSENEMNRAGYWQVEEDVWFNPISKRCLTGHAYHPREADQRRADHRTESQQIRALYRTMKHNGGSTSTSKGTWLQRSGLMD